jgi:iron(III) transport system ATP-binding protein
MALAAEAAREPASHLQLRGLRKRFGAFTALDGIDLDVREGEFLTFLGPSGCGKTTLLRVIAGLEVQDEGSLWQGGVEISGRPVGQRNFGIVFQSYALFPNLSVRDNVAYGLASARRPRAEVSSRVDELVALVGLEAHGDKYPAQLSGGQQQRVALARALALRPALLLLDEPLSALDAQVRARLRGELRGLQRRLGVTTIMVTHDQEEALTMSDRIAVMRDGRFEQVGTPTEIYARPETPFVADFVGRMNFLSGELRTPSAVEVDGLTLQLETPVALPRGAAVTVCLRPEDLAVRWPAGPAANLLPATVERLEFLGSYWAATLVAGPGLLLAADLSMADVRELGLEPGRRLEVQLPPARLRVFPRGAAAAR